MNFIKYLRRVSFFSLALVVLTSAKSANNNFEISKNLDIFHSIFRELDMYYVDTIDAEKVIGVGIDAMLAALDPYTDYFRESDQNELKMMTTGKYAGIGAIIRQYKNKDYIAIEEPYEGMPAAKYGLKAGDLVLAIDGASMKGKSSSEVSNTLRGEPDSKFKITVKRPGVPDSLNYEITRSIIAMPSVPYYGIHKGVGYIVLESFTENCSSDVRKAIIELKAKGAKSLVLDLRGNGGGLLQEAVDIVGLFVPKGTRVVETKGKIAQASKVYSTRRDPLDSRIPLAVLVDESSASASEIVSGSLQDLDRAVIVGTRTFGKGLVQVTRNLPYDGTLKVTTSKYYIPSGRCIQKIDYSSRNKNGQAQNIPDSLIHVFKTAAGRTVKDGGGIRPDVECRLDTMPDILYYLSTDVTLFDFVNEFCANNKTIAPVNEFEVSDTLFESFCDYIQKSGFSFISNSSKALKALRQIAEVEGLSGKAKSEFDALELKLQYDLKTDLNTFEKEIKKMLSISIASRYYYQRGAIVQRLKDDMFFNDAVSVLSDSKRYESILKP
jgi:carboxyl-terminal processing protease